MDNLLEKNNINSIIDIADSYDDIDKYIASDGFNSYYTKSIYDEGNLIALAMGSGYTTDSYKKSLAIGIRHMLNTEGPYYIHCMEGKDRTGFISMLIEALFGASYEEMCNDYMTTYQNYYKINKENTPDKYKAVVELYFDSFMEYLLGRSKKEDLIEASYIESAKEYLLDGGLTLEEINKFIDKFSK